MDWNTEDVEELTSDFHRSAIGRFIVDVSWKPEKDPSGEFLCRVILDGNWQYPIEELRTQDPDKMARWTVNQMKEAARRSNGSGVSETEGS